MCPRKTCMLTGSQNGGTESTVVSEPTFVGVREKGQTFSVHVLESAFMAYSVVSFPSFFFTSLT